MNSKHIAFEHAVLERSHRIPVLVMFGAAWFSPCRTLTATLEELHRERPDDFELVMIDTEHAFALAERLGIRGIPRVQLFVDGELAAEFQGFRTALDVRQFLAAHIPGPKPVR